MTHRQRFRRDLARTLAVLGIATLGACTGGEDSGGGPLLNPGDLGGGSSGPLTVEGPAGEPSGALTIDAGSEIAGFVATVTSASGRPAPNVLVTFRPDRGSVTAQRPGGGDSPGGAITNIDGQVRFAYAAPDAVTDLSTVTILASARIPNSTPSTADDPVAEERYELVVVPASPAELTLSGPADVAPGVDNAGFAAIVVREDGTEVEDACVTLTPSAGTILPAAASCAGGRTGLLTDALGRVDFRLRTPASTADTTITIAGEVLANGVTSRDTLLVNVRADTFRFTAPDPSTAVLVGAANAEPLDFQWTRAAATGGAGVEGTLALSSTRGFFVVNGVQRPAGQSVTVTTTAASGGDFVEDVRIGSNSGGPATVTARDAIANRSASVAVQFVDTAGEVNLDAQPLLVTCSPNSNRFSTLTVTVLNGAGAPVAGVPVSFVLAAAAGGANERVFPLRQLTNDQGVATSRYEAGTGTGTASVFAQVDGGSASNTRNITVQAPAPDGGTACN